MPGCSLKQPGIQQSLELFHARLPNLSEARLASSSFLNPLGVLITKPFAGSYEAGQRAPWTAMGTYLADVQLQEHYLGFVYLAAGVKEGPLESGR
jgi:hypothetical protein